MTDALQEAVRLHQAGRRAEAESRYRAILAREPANSDALHYLGLIQYGAGKWESAAELLQRSVVANDRNAAAWSNLGNALTMVSRLPEAEAAFRSALRIDPGFADASFNLGNALRQQQRLAEAEECYRQAATSNPLHAGASTTALPNHRRDDGSVRSWLFPSGMRIAAGHDARYSGRSPRDEASADVGDGTTRVAWRRC